MHTISERAAVLALLLGVHVGAAAAVASVVTGASRTAARLVCQREARLALLSDAHCAARKGSAAYIAGGY